MPRILLLADASSIHTARWANAIVNHGWQVHLASLQGVREPLDARISYHRAPIPAPLGYVANSHWFHNLINRIKPELLHAHFASGYGTMAALSKFNPLILSVWGSDIYDFPRKSILHRTLIKCNLSKVTQITSTSHVMAIEAQKYAKRRIVVVPFGIDVDQFKPQPVLGPFDPADIVIGTVKTLEAKYGIEYLIRAFKILKDRHPSLPLKLLIVGGGSLLNHLTWLAKSLGLGQDAVFTGYIQHKEIHTYQNMMSISAFLSVLDSESFGVSVLEASACEKPVVVSGVGGLPEVTEDGITGIVVPPRDIQRSADALERLVLDQELRLRMGKRGRERVEGVYSWQDSVRRMCQLYDEVIRVRSVEM